MTPGSPKKPLGVPCEPGVRDRLFTQTFDDLDQTRREAYVGHLLLRVMDWSIRKGRNHGRRSELE